MDTLPEVAAELRATADAFPSDVLREFAVGAHPRHRRWLDLDGRRPSS